MANSQDNSTENLEKIKTPKTTTEKPKKTNTIFEKENSLENVGQEEKIEQTPNINEEKKETEKASPLISSHQHNIQLKEREKKIEKILEKDLENLYLQLNPSQQQKFKKSGEKTAQQINSLLEKTKVKIKQIINLIKSWLKMIPGINNFFLEQEAKIKADEIIKTKK